jgi:hypothetical protein
MTKDSDTQDAENNGEGEKHQASSSAPAAANEFTTHTGLGEPKKGKHAGCETRRRTDSEGETQLVVDSNRSFSVVGAHS